SDGRGERTGAGGGGQRHAAGEGPQRQAQGQGRAPAAGQAPQGAAARAAAGRGRGGGGGRGAGAVGGPLHRERRPADRVALAAQRPAGGRHRRRHGGQRACRASHGSPGGAPVRPWARGYTVAAVLLSVLLNAYAFGLHATDGMVWAAWLLGAVIPCLVYALGRVAGHLWQAGE